MSIIIIKIIIIIIIIIFLKHCLKHKQSHWWLMVLSLNIHHYSFKHGNLHQRNRLNKGSNDRGSVTYTRTADEATPAQSCTAAKQSRVQHVSHRTWKQHSTHHTCDVTRQKHHKTPITTVKHPAAWPICNCPSSSLLNVDLHHPRTTKVPSAISDSGEDLNLQTTNTWSDDSPWQCGGGVPWHCFLLHCLLYEYGEQMGKRSMLAGESRN